MIALMEQVVKPWTRLWDREGKGGLPPARQWS